jgi:Protein of unknown function (DUF416)
VTTYPCDIVGSKFGGSMLKFDERTLSEALSGLPPDYRAAFAAACAQRLSPCYRRFCANVGERNLDDRLVFLSSLERLWLDLSGERLERDETRSLIQRLLASVPDEESAWKANEPYAIDAAASIVYAWQARERGEMQFAVWSAKRAYEALDNFIINNFFANEAKVNEEAVLKHPLIQNELERQRSDIESLHSALISDFKKPEVLLQLKNLAIEQSEHFFDEMTSRMNE